MRRRQRRSKRSRILLIPSDNASHHKADPANTPAIIGHGELEAKAVLIEPKIATKDKIVIGFDKVSRKVPEKQRPSSPALVTLAALRAGSRCQVRHAR